MICTLLAKFREQVSGDKMLTWIKLQSTGAIPKSRFIPLDLVVYIALVVFFAYFYTSITFNPLEIADNMKKSGWIYSGYPSR